MADQPAAWPGLGRSATSGRSAWSWCPTHGTSPRRPAGGRPRWGAGLAFPGSRTILLRADAGDLTGRCVTSWPTWRCTRRSGAGCRSGSTRAMPRWRPASGTGSTRSGSTWRSRADRCPTSGRWTPACAAAGRRRTRPTRWPMSAVMELAAAIPPAPHAAAVPGSSGALVRRGVAAHDRAGRRTGSRTTWQRSVRQRYSSCVWLAAAGFWVVIAFSLGVLPGYRRRRDRPRRLALDEGWTLPAEPDDDQRRPDTGRPDATDRPSGEGA